MKVCIFYHFEIRNSKLSLDFKRFEVFDPLTQKTYPAESVLEKFQSNVKFDESVKIFKFS